MLQVQGYIIIQQKEFILTKPETYEWISTNTSSYVQQTMYLPHASSRQLLLIIPANLCPWNIYVLIIPHDAFQSLATLSFQVVSSNSSDLALITGVSHYQVDPCVITRIQYAYVKLSDEDIANLPWHQLELILMIARYGKLLALGTVAS